MPQDIFKEKAFCKWVILDGNFETFPTLIPTVCTRRKHESYCLGSLHDSDDKQNMAEVNP